MAIDRIALTSKPGGNAQSVTVVSGLMIAGVTDGWLGTLDLGDSDLVIRVASAKRKDVLATTLNQVKMGRNGSVGLWKGKGINSSAAAEDGREMTGLGVILNEDGEGGPALYKAFDGQNVDLNTVLVKFTWNGDANLDGLVNADDYFLIDSGYITQKKGWSNGDFNYDAIINADDYFLIDSAYIAQAGQLSGDVMRVVAQVPEPGVGIAVVAMLVMLGTKRRA